MSSHYRRSHYRRLKDGHRIYVRGHDVSREDYEDLSPYYKPVRIDPPIIADPSDLHKVRVYKQNLYMANYRARKEAKEIEEDLIREDDCTFFNNDDYSSYQDKRPWDFRVLTQNGSSNLSREECYTIPDPKLNRDRLKENNLLSLVYIFGLITCLSFLVGIIGFYILVRLDPVIALIGAALLGYLLSRDEGLRY